MRADQYQEGGRYLHVAEHELDQLLQGPVYSMPAERFVRKAPDPRLDEFQAELADIDAGEAHQLDGVG